MGGNEAVYSSLSKAVPVLAYFTETDADLVTAAQAGDARAYRELVERYHGRMYHLAATFVGDPDDADDVAQEIFVKAFGALAAFRGQSQFYTWLYRIGMNACMDWVKARSRRQEGNVRAQADGSTAGGAAGMGSAAPPADARVERRELRETLRAALNELPEEYRATVVLRELQGFSYDEIAETLSCSIGTVKSRLFRARAQLHQILTREPR